jgi:hypothetical protein
MPAAGLVTLTPVSVTGQPAGSSGGAVPQRLCATHPPRSVRRLQPKTDSIGLDTRVSHRTLRLSTTLRRSSKGRPVILRICFITLCDGSGTERYVHKIGHKLLFGTPNFMINSTREATPNLR